MKRNVEYAYDVIRRENGEVECVFSSPKWWKRAGYALNRAKYALTYEAEFVQELIIWERGEKPIRHEDGSTGWEPYHNELWVFELTHGVVGYTLGQQIG